MLKDFFKGRQGYSKQFYIWFFSYMIIVLVGVILSSVLHSSSAGVVRRQAEENMHFTIEQMRFVYDEDFLDVQTAAYNILEDSTVKSLSDSVLYLDYSQRRVKYKEVCQRIASEINDNIEHFFVVFENDDLVLDHSGSAEKKVIYDNYFKYYYNSAEEWLADFNLAGSHNDCKILKAEDGKTVLCYASRTPVSVIAPVKATAIIILDMNELVHNRLNIAEYTSPIMTVSDQNGEILFSSQGIGTMTVHPSENESEYISVSAPSQFMNWKYTLSIPTGNLYTNLRTIQLLALLIYFIYLIFGIALSYMLSKMSYRPLSNLITKFKKEPFSASQSEFSYLDDQISRMVERDRQSQKELSSRLSKLQEHYLVDLLFGRAADSKNSEAYNLEFKNKYFYVVLFKVIDTGIFNDDGKNNKETVNFLIQNIIAENMQDISSTYFFNCENMYACIINSRDELQEIEICSQTEFTIQFLRENFSTGVICAVSGVAYSPNQLPMLYTQVKDIISIGTNSSDNSVLLSDVLQKIPYIYPQETEHLLTNTLMRGEYEQAKSIIDDIFEKTFGSNDVIPSIKQVLFCDLIGTVLKVCVTVNAGSQFVSIHNEVLHANSIEASKIILLDYIKKLCGIINESRENIDNRIARIILFVEQNYNDSNLNVSYIANKFNITINYLSSYFKTKTGQVLSDYILSYRLEKACEMLRDKASVTKTCHSCGFSDVNAFIRAFKKKYGVTPGKYLE